MPSEMSSLCFARWQRLIPVGLFVLVVTIGLPAILHLRENARRAHSGNNLRQFQLGLHNYNDVFNTLPPGGTFDANGVGYHGWMTSVEPFLAASPWYTFVDYNVPWDDPLNVDVFMIPSFGSRSQNPGVTETKSGDGFPLAHYCANQNLMCRNSVCRLSDLGNGAGNTILLGDANGNYVPTGYPYNWRNPSPSGTGPREFGCPIRNVTMVIMADGSVRILSSATDSEVMSKMSGSDLVKRGPNELLKPSDPYRLKNLNFWKFRWCQKDDHKGIETFKLSPDGKKLVVCSPSTASESTFASHWVSTLESLTRSSPVEVVEIRGSIDRTELEPFLKLPQLKTLILSDAYVRGEVKSVFEMIPKEVDVKWRDYVRPDSVSSP